MKRAKQTVREARAVVAEARRAKRGRAAALVDQLERELAAAEQVLAQTDLRLAGQRTIPDRRISLVDPDARPIRMSTSLRRNWLLNTPTSVRITSSTRRVRSSIEILCFVS